MLKYSTNVEMLANTIFGSIGEELVLCNTRTSEKEAVKVLASALNDAIWMVAFIDVASNPL